MSVISNTVYSMLVKCKICKKQVRRYDVGAPSGITISLPGAESQDAERRRQIALRALSGRNISPQDANAIIEPTESLKSPLKSKLSSLEGGTLVHNN